ncbi:MAG: YceI family protein [Crocinitomicaceae bacterium]|nr:YceI family protein [Crocinitomicaceae bacterium]
MSNVRILICLMAFVVSCSNQENTENSSLNLNGTLSTDISNDTLLVDLSKSTIDWKGTKMMGRGKHVGRIQLMNGYTVMEGDKLIGGQFVVDMNSIEVTDIPSHEPVPRKRFIDHMKSEDFFETSKFPTSKFVITKTVSINEDSSQVSGDLTIKDVTNSVTFKIHNDGQQFSTKFSFNRFLWNIDYVGNESDESQVDKDIELDIKIVTLNKIE